MKKILLMISITFMFVSAFSQTNDSCLIYAEKQDAMLYLYMNPKEYKKLSLEHKKELIKNEANKHSAVLVSVINGYEIELWRNTYNTIVVVEKWDKNNVNYKYDGKDVSDKNIRNLKHPWFCNVSGSITFNNNNNTFYFSCYGRVGFYLLKSRWDLAVNNTMTYSKEVINYGTDAELKKSFTGYFGIDSRVYFPIQSIKLSPFVGLGLARTYGKNNKSTSIPISLGLSKPTKKGCWDVCYQYAKTTKGIFVVGYTFILK